MAFCYHVEQNDGNLPLAPPQHNFTFNCCNYIPHAQGLFANIGLFT
jgi:hypothetical protein